jgi:hypothetical protein
LQILLALITPLYAVLHPLTHTGLITQFACRERELSRFLLPATPIRETPASAGSLDDFRCSGMPSGFASKGCGC